MKVMIKNFVQRTAFIKRFASIYKALYKYSIFILNIASKIMLDAESMHLRWGLDSENLVPGLSDLDMIIIIKKTTAIKDFYRVSKFFRFYFLLKKVFPFLGHIFIVTDEVMNGWLTWGDIRAYELSVFYVTVYGPPMPKNKYRFIAEKFTLDCISEGFFSNYQRLLRLYIKGEFNHSSKIMRRNVWKFFCDGFRYHYYAAQGKYINYKTRFDFLNSFKNTDYLPEAIINEALYIYSSQFAAISRSFIADTLVHLLLYMDKICELRCADLKLSNNYYKTIKIQKAQADSAKIPNYKYQLLCDLANEIGHELGNSIDKIFYHQYYFYIVLKNKINFNEIHYIFRKINNLLDKYKKHNLDNCEISILTNSILSCINHSMPYHIYSYREKEVKLYGDFEEETSFAVLAPALIGHAYYANIDLRANGNMSRRRYLSAVCGELLPELLLALDKGYMIDSSEKFNIAFRDHYPDLYRKLDYIKSAPALKKNGENKEPNLEYYSLTVAILDKLNQVIARKYNSVR